MEAAVVEESYTTKDIEAMPEGVRAELLDGRIFDMSSPTRTHQQISMYLSVEISKYIELNQGECEVYAAPFAVYIGNDDENYVEPDISVICDKDKLDEKGCHGAPDWIIEIVSASSRRMDYFRKLFKYESAGVREYWIVDPDKKIVTVYDFKGETGEEYPFGSEVPVSIYQGFKIKIPA